MPDICLFHPTADYITAGAQTEKAARFLAQYIGVSRKEWGEDAQDVEITVSRADLGRFKEAAEFYAFSTDAEEIGV